MRFPGCAWYTDGKCLDNAEPPEIAKRSAKDPQDPVFLLSFDHAEIALTCADTKNKSVVVHRVKLSLANVGSALSPC